MRVVPCSLVVTFVYAGAVGVAGCEQPSQPATDARRCDLAPAGPVWVTEGDPVEVTLSCATAGTDADPGPVSFALAAVPDGARFDADTATLTWTPGLDQAAVYDIAVTVPELDESAALRIGVADRFDDPLNVPIVDPTAYSFEYGLPVLFLSPRPGDSEIYAPAEVIYRGERQAGVEAKLRGRTSLDFPKNSFTLRFPDSVRFSDPDRDFLNKRRVVLTTPFDDTSYVRGRLAFDLWNALDPVVPVQSYTAVVYIDGAFAGLYTVMDHIDDELLEQHGLDNDGNIYKALDHDANFRLVGLNGQAKQTLHDGYEKKSGEPAPGQPGAFADLDALVQLVGTASDSELSSRLPAEIDADGYLGWWMIVQFLGADDNAGKNTYHYHFADTPWVVIPWDFSASAGQTFTTDRRSPQAVDDYAWANELFVRFEDVEPFASQMGPRLRAALDGPWSAEAVDALLAEYQADIAPEAIARDQARWGDEFRSYSLWDHRTDFLTPAQELEYVRAWLAERRDVLRARY